MFKFVLLALLMAIAVKSEIISVDKYDYQWNSWDFEHLEGRRFYLSEEEAVGVPVSGTPTPPNHMGVWVFESHGPGGCCGGRWDVIAPMFDPETDRVEMLITYASNKPLSVEGYGSKGEVVPTVDRRIIIDPANTTIINWRTEFLTFGEGTRFGRLQVELGPDRSGYMFLDKIILAKNEPIPRHYF